MSSTTAQWLTGRFRASLLALAAASSFAALRARRPQDARHAAGHHAAAHHRNRACRPGVGRRRVPQGRGVGVASARGEGRRRCAGARWQRDRRGRRDPVHAQRGGAAVLRHRRGRFHDGAPGQAPPTLLRSMRAKRHPRLRRRRMFLLHRRACRRNCSDWRRPAASPWACRARWPALDTALQPLGHDLACAMRVAPAIEVAENGFRINRFLAANIANDGGRTSFQPETAAIFRPGGVPLKEGDLLVQPDLAHTLRLIARDRAPNVFYRGASRRPSSTRRNAPAAPLPAEGRGPHDAAGPGELPGRDPRAGARSTIAAGPVAAMSPPSSGGLTVGQMLLMLRALPARRRGAGLTVSAPPRRCT